MSFICMFISISVFRRNFTCLSLMIQGIRPQRSVPRIKIALGICISWVSILKKCQFRIAVHIESCPRFYYTSFTTSCCCYYYQHHHFNYYYFFFLSWEKQVPSLVDGKRRYLTLVSDFVSWDEATKNHSFTSATYLLLSSTRDGTSISSIL